MADNDAKQVTRYPQGDLYLYAFREPDPQVHFEISSIPGRYTHVIPSDGRTVEIEVKKGSFHIHVRTVLTPEGFRNDR